MSKTFCPIPWIFQAVRNNGDIRICCQANATKNKGVVRHPEGRSFNAGRDSMEEARNAELMKTVRKNMIEGIWSDECGRCQSEEQTGLESRRMYEMRNWPNMTHDVAKSVTDADGTIDTDSVPVVYFDLRFGNLCNLACRMCGPTDSHTWYDQWIGYHGGTGYDDTHGYVKLQKNSKGRLFTHDYNWHMDENFWDYLERMIPQINHVYLAGGEPMMIERHFEFLRKCIELDSAKNMLIEYNTNMTNLPKKVLKLWESFKQVRVGASIDGMGKVVEYQRWPLKWNQAYSNLQKLDKTPKNVMAWLAFTVTVYNIFHLPEFMWWKLKESGFNKINSTRHKPVITHHVAHGPKRANIRLLPSKIKQEVIKYYNEYKEKVEKDNEISPEVKIKFNEILDGVIKYMEADDYSSDINEFIKFTNYLDKQRNQNIIDVVPQYKRLFDT